MARRNVLLGITQAENKSAERDTTPGYTMRGASKSMLSSINELAAQAARADQLIEGASVVEISPDLIDSSFVSDRMAGGEEAFQELVTAIRERGQDSPILLRPHPETSDRYMVVFGHRRLRAARELGRPVRAVVKPLADIEHVIAQGQENSARENLSFIERAVFAQHLVDLGYGRDTVQTALSVDAPMLTRMLSVTKRVPVELIEAIGAARTVGRDRWLELTTLLDDPLLLDKANSLSKTEEFSALESDARFAALLSACKTSQPAPKKSPSRINRDKIWKPSDGRISASIKSTPKNFSLSIKAEEAGRFGNFISENLDALYEAFRNSDSNRPGD